MQVAIHEHMNELSARDLSCMLRSDATFTICLIIRHFTVGLRPLALSLDLRPWTISLGLTSVLSIDLRSSLIKQSIFLEVLRFHFFKRFMKRNTL